MNFWSQRYFSAGNLSTLLVVCKVSSRLPTARRRLPYIVDFFPFFWSNSLTATEKNPILPGSFNFMHRLMLSYDECVYDLTNRVQFLLNWKILEVKIYCEEDWTLRNVWSESWCWVHKRVKWKHLILILILDVETFVFNFYTLHVSSSHILEIWASYFMSNVM